MRRSVRLSLEQLHPWLLELPVEPGPLDFARLFGNANPVEMEVGFGKGLFLLSTSQAHPETNFLGVEIERKYTLYVANRLAKRDRRNVRVVAADARLFLPGFLPVASLQAVHVFFPDPWWKTKHRKRRVFTEAFARECGSALQPGGRLHVVSDVAEYFETITALMAQLPEFALLPPPEVKDPEHDLDYLTNFDRKYRKEGRLIHRAQYARREP